MIKQRINKTIWLATTLAIGVVVAILLECCTASMSLFWKNQNSSQGTQQSTTTRVDTLKTSDINVKL